MIATDGFYVPKAAPSKCGGYIAAPARQRSSMTQNIETPLHDIAHSRAGDKGNRVNLSLMPYDPAHYALLAEQVTAEKVLALFRHRGATGCKRYDLPLLHAFNFVIDDVLEGGVNGSLNLDGHGKSHSFRLLAMTIEVPKALLNRP